MKLIREVNKEAKSGEVGKDVQQQKYEYRFHVERTAAIDSG